MKQTTPILGREVEADISEVGLIAMHAPLTGGKGWTLTHIPTGMLLLRTRLKGEARAARAKLEAAEDLQTTLSELRGRPSQ